MKPVLKQWRFDFEGRLWGNVWYHPGFRQDESIRTSKVIKLEKGEATTVSGTIYVLGCPEDCLQETTIEFVLARGKDNANNSF